MITNAVRKDKRKTVPVRATLQLCPSARPDSGNAVAIGIVGGTADQPRVTYLARPRSVSDELLALAKPVTPTEVFRFAAPCVRKGCVQFEDGKCQIGLWLARLLPTVVDR